MTRSTTATFLFRFLRDRAPGVEPAWRSCIINLTLPCISARSFTLFISDFRFLNSNYMYLLCLRIKNAYNQRLNLPFQGENTPFYRVPGALVRAMLSCPSRAQPAVLKQTLTTHCSLFLLPLTSGYLPPFLSDFQPLKLWILNLNSGKAYTHFSLLTTHFSFSLTSSSVRHPVSGYSRLNSPSAPSTYPGYFRCARSGRLPEIQVAGNMRLPGHWWPGCRPRGS